MTTKLFLCYLYSNLFWKIMLVGKGGKITKLEIKKCKFYSPCESRYILKMLCKNHEGPGFISGGDTGFVLRGRLIISSTNQYSRLKLKKQMASICNIQYYLKLTSCSGISNPLMVENLNLPLKATWFLLV